MKRKKDVVVALFLLLIFIVGINYSVYAGEEKDTGVHLKKNPSEVIREITIEDLLKEKIVKNEEFNIGNTKYTRNYITEDDYYVSCIENGKTQYYVNLLKIFPLCKYTETVNPSWKSKEYEDKKLVKIYYDKYEHFITTFDLFDTKQVKVFVKEEESVIGMKEFHFIKIEK